MFYFHILAPSIEIEVRRIYAIIIPLSLMLLVFLQGTSCEKYVLPEMSFAPDTLYFSAAGGVQSFTVTTNVICTVDRDKEIKWIVADPYFLEESAVVNLTVEANPGTTARTAALPVKTESFLKYLTVIQEGDAPTEPTEPAGPAE